MNNNIKTTTTAGTSAQTVAANATTTGFMQVYPNPQPVQVCPTCGICPTCGKQTHPFYLPMPVTSAPQPYTVTCLKVY